MARGLGPGVISGAAVLHQPERAPPALVRPAQYTEIKRRTEQSLGGKPHVTDLLSGRERSLRQIERGPAIFGRGRTPIHVVPHQPERGIADGLVVAEVLADGQRTFQHGSANVSPSAEHVGITGFE
jgi:hypothetical protein